MSTIDTLATRHYCARCGPDRALTVQYDRAREWRPWCPTCRSFENLAKRKEKSPFQQCREDPDSVPIAVKNRYADKHRDEIEEVAAALPEDLGQVVREKFFGLPVPVREEK